MLMGVRYAWMDVKKDNTQEDLKFHSKDIKWHSENNHTKKTKSQSFHDCFANNLDFISLTSNYPDNDAKMFERIIMNAYAMNVLCLLSDLNIFLYIREVRELDRIGIDF